MQPEIAKMIRRKTANWPALIAESYLLIEVSSQNRTRFPLPKFLSLSDYPAFIRDESVCVAVWADRDFLGNDRLTADTNFILRRVTDDLVRPFRAFI